jgi:Zn-finger nucleic acid-binding protein
MDCPDCQGTLRVTVEHGIEVDRCACGGAWFDFGELERHRAAGARGGAQLALVLSDVPAGKCPKCRSVILRSGTAGPLKVGACVRCKGLWVSRSLSDADIRKKVGEIGLDLTATLVEVVLLILPG